MVSGIKTLRKKESNYTDELYKSSPHPRLSSVPSQMSQSTVVFQFLEQSLNVLLYTEGMLIGHSHNCCRLTNTMLGWHVFSHLSCTSLLLSLPFSITVISSTWSSFSVFIIMGCCFYLQVLLFFQTKEKENHTTSQMTGHRQILGSYLHVHMLSRD